ncbi:MAG: hypothetical protein ACRDTI_06630 [Mycobacterium sp.]
MSTVGLAGDEPQPRASSVGEIRRLVREGLCGVVDDTAAEVAWRIADAARHSAAIAARALGELLDPLPSQVADRASEGEAPASDGTTTGAGHQARPACQTTE